MPESSARASVFSIALALLVCFLIIAATWGELGTAVAAYTEMLKGGLGDFGTWFDGGTAAVVLRPLGESSVKATLLMLTGLSVAIGLTVGLFNLGAQGQFLLGAIAAAVTGAYLSLPAIVHLPICLLASALVGAAYAWIPTMLKLKRGVHEVISTIMLNWVAMNLVENWWVVGPLKATAQGSSSRSGTEDIAATAQLPRLLGNLSRLNLGFVLAVVAAIVVWWWLKRSTHGFESRAVGLSQDAARAAGLPVQRRWVQAMLASGALSGIAGAVWVLGTEYKFPATVGGAYGFDGIAMALLGQGNPLGVAASSLFFGILRAGGTRMQLLGVHKSFPELIQGLALLFVAASLLWSRWLSRPKKAPMTAVPEVKGAPSV